MNEKGAGPADWPVVVRVPVEPVEPVEAAMEADALDAALHSTLAVRGPLFGVATQRTGDGRRWRVAVEVTHGCPQQARDSLNSLLWFRAKDEAKDRAERRALLAAVARLESERVDELTVLDTRYRVVRAEEYAGMDANGDIETPRPTDPEPLTPDWGPGTHGPRVDADLVLDPDAPLSPVQASERLSLRSLVYTGTRFPDSVLGDSVRAVESHPDVLLMPAAFQVVERSGTRSWRPGSALHVSAHDARVTLYFSLMWFRPRLRARSPTRHPETSTRTPPPPRTPPQRRNWRHSPRPQTGSAGPAQPGRSPGHRAPDRPHPPPAALGPRRAGRPTPFRHQHPGARSHSPPPRRGRHRPFRGVRAGGSLVTA